MQSVHRFVELWPVRSCAGNSVVAVEVVSTNTRIDEIRYLPVGVLLSRRYSRVSDELAHAAPLSVLQQ